jgi:hypothetical protein
MCINQEDIKAGVGRGGKGDSDGGGRDLMHVE